MVGVAMKRAHMNAAALSVLLLAGLVGVCLAESEPLEPPPVTIDPGSDTDVMEELPNSGVQRPEMQSQGRILCCSVVLTHHDIVCPCSLPQKSELYM